MSDVDHTSKVLIWGQPASVGEFLWHSLHRFGLQVKRRETTPGLDAGGQTWEVAECLSDLGIDPDLARPGDTTARLELSEHVDDDLIIEVSNVYPDLTFHTTWAAWAYDGSRDEYGGDEYGGDECGEDECGDPWRLWDEGGVTARAGFPI